MMLYKIKLLLFIFLICHDPKVFGSEIVNGRKAKKGSLLYMASVQINNEHRCGGFLVSEDFVITAAHCESKNLLVVLGTHNIKNVEKSNQYKVTQQCKHPEYDNLLKGNDIMLLKLSRKASPSETKKTIHLPHKGKIIKKTSNCLVAGWGKTESESPTVNDLRVVNVSIINWNDCNEKWGKRLSPNVICAGGSNSDKGFCQGDSGGPLVCDGTVAGVASFNNNQDCNYPNVPNVYTNISNYLPWINKILKEKKC